MAKAPAFQWYPKECDSDENVRLMDDAEFGFYVRCLNHAWINDGLPHILDDLARAIGRPPKTVQRYWVRVGKCFSETDGRYRNPRQELQRADARAFKEAKISAANKRWGANAKPMQSTCTTDAGALHVDMHMQCPASSSAPATAPASANQEEKHLSPAEAADARLKSLGWVGVAKTPEDVCVKIAAIPLEELPESKSLSSPYMIVCRLNWFDDFIAYYWRKDDRRQARIKYFEKVTSETLRDEIERAVIDQSPEMLAREKQYQPLPATWLHRERWLNEPLLVAAADD